MLEKRKLKKRVLIDFLSVSMDFVDVHRASRNLYQLVGNMNLFARFIQLLGFQESYLRLPTGQPVRGYTNALVIGEHIKILYGGEHTKNSKGRYSINLLMSGQACREFENFLGGNWTELMSFLIEQDASFKRIDIAIDDFDGEQIDIYDIEPILRSNHFVSPFRKINYQFTERYKSNLVVSEGFTITLGSAGSNQLQIYDKRLERNARGEPDLDTDIWYRYEMRFVNEKADAVAQLYVTSIQENNSTQFMTYARELLINCLDLKKPNNKNRQVTRWKTDDRWLAFLDSVEKIDLNVKHRVETTIEKRKTWYKRSLKKVNAAFYAGFDGDENFMSYILKNVLSGLEELKPQDIAMINNYRENNGHKKIKLEDILETVKNIKEHLGEDDE